MIGLASDPKPMNQSCPDSRASRFFSPRLGRRVNARDLRMWIVRELDRRYDRGVRRRAGSAMLARRASKYFGCSITVLDVAMVA